MEHRENKENETEVFETQGLRSFHISDRQKVTDPEDPTLEKKNDRKKELHSGILYLSYRKQKAKAKRKSCKRPGVMRNNLPVKEQD